MFLGLSDPDPIVRGTDPAPDLDQAKIARKTYIPTVLWLFYDFLSLKNDVNVQKVIIKKSWKTNNLLVLSGRSQSLTEIAGFGVRSGSIGQKYGSVPKCPGSATLA
jgi:hypothetical protein